jgi:alpha-tubulin suppressor-like RCC1 family protein
MISDRLTRILKLCVAVAVVAGGTATLAQLTGQAPAAAAGGPDVLYAWGSNDSGQLGDNISTGGHSNTPVVVGLPAGVTPMALAGGGGGGDPIPPQHAGYAIGSDGHLYAWGDNTSGGLGNGSTGGSVDTPVVVSLPPGVTPTAIAAAQGGAFASGSDGHLYAWGDNQLGLLGNGSIGGFNATPASVHLPAGVTPTSIAAGYESAYTLGSDGKLYSWGDNFYGELGDGSNTNSGQPVVVGFPTGVTPTSITGGGGTGYARGSDGKLYSWGYNVNGGLGDGTTTNANAPVVVGLPAGVSATAVAGGGGYACAIGSNGTLYCWGNNFDGELGNGNTTNTSTPGPVSMPAGVSASSISAAAGATFAIGSNGTLYAWGRNTDSELGNGSSGTGSTLPVAVSLPAGSTPHLLGAESGSQSGYAIVSPGTALVVSNQPANQRVNQGTSATFTAAATGGSPGPTVQWEVSTDGGLSFAPITGATSGTLTLSSVALADSGNQYKAMFTNSAGTAFSNPALLTVDPFSAPVVTTQPTAQTVFAGENASFSAAADGAPAPTVQWQVSTDGGVTFSPISGATADTLTLSSVALADSGNQYKAVFTNSAGTATSNPALLTVKPDTAPVVTTQPTNQSGIVGQTVFFTSTASGGPAPSVQWQFSMDGGSTWADCQTNATSTTVGLVLWGTFENGWELRAVFTNRAGSATSNPALVTVS